MGLFSMIFTSLNPHIPVIEEGRLTDPKQAEHFLSRVHFYRMVDYGQKWLGRKQDYAISQ